VLYTARQIDAISGVAEFPNGPWRPYPENGGAIIKAVAGNRNTA
jgi:hypothetical protein